MNLSYKSIRLLSEIKPDNWTYTKWLSTIRNGKIVIIDGEINDRKSKIVSFVSNLINNHPDISTEELDNSISVFGELLGSTPPIPFHEFIHSDEAIKNKDDYVKWKIYV